MHPWSTLLMSSCYCNNLHANGRQKHRAVFRSCKLPVKVHNFTQTCNCLVCQNLKKRSGRWNHVINKCVRSNKCKNKEPLSLSGDSRILTSDSLVCVCWIAFVSENSKLLSSRTVQSQQDTAMRWTNWHPRTCSDWNYLRRAHSRMFLEIQVSKPTELHDPFIFDSIWLLLNAPSSCIDVRSCLTQIKNFCMLLIWFDLWLKTQRWHALIWHEKRFH